MRRERHVLWEEPGLEGPSIRIEEIDDFVARGMKRVYGRADHFNRQKLNMDVWITRSNRLLARFWSRGVDSDTHSYEVSGVEIDWGRTSSKRHDLGDRCVPELLRDEYDNWVISELHWPSPLDAG